MQFIEKLEIDKVFPFLIGRIRTEVTGIKMYRVARFPFLIGRIRTYSESRYSDWCIAQFPFLIGRIRT